MDRYDQMIDRSEKSSDWLATAPRVSSAKIEGGRLVLELTTGVVISVPWLHVRLGTRLPDLLEIMRGGLDVYFPDLDEAVFVPDLLADIARSSIVTAFAGGKSSAEDGLARTIKP